jgi:hypothetical protein
MATPDIFLFVSHVREDRSDAEDIVGELERRGVRCWIAPRNVRPGKPFDDEIAEAIDTSRAMLLIFSERCNESEYIRREVTVAGEAGKVIIPFRIDNSQPKKGLRVRLTDLHWIDGFVSRERAIDELVGAFDPAPGETVLNTVIGQAPRQDARRILQETGGDKQRAQTRKGSQSGRSRWAAFVAASALAAALAGALLFWMKIGPPAQSLDASLLGTWRGEGHQVPQGPSQGWTIVMSIREDGANIEYPSLECGGTLTQISSSDTTAQYREAITHMDGSHRCVDGGLVTVRYMNGGLFYTWTALVNGARYNASAVMTHD